MKQILVIEDERPIRSYIQKLLRKEGYHVVEAADGWEGVRLARQRQPDLIVSDINLPGLNGYGILQTLRQDTLTTKIPFLFLTSKTQPDDIRLGLRLGSDQYLTKPVIQSELIGSVAATLATHAHQSYPQDRIPPLSDFQRAGWMYYHLSKPILDPQYSGWYVAIEPKTGKCFVGRNQQETYALAQRTMPGKIFFYQQVGME